MRDSDSRARRGRALRVVLDFAPFPPRVLRIPIFLAALGLVGAVTLATWGIVSAVMLVGPRWIPLLAPHATSASGPSLIEGAASTVSSHPVIKAVSPFSLPVEATVEQDIPALPAPHLRKTLGSVRPSKGTGFRLDALGASTDLDSGAVNVTFRMAGTTGTFRRGFYRVKATFVRADGGVSNVEPTGTPGAVAYALRNYADRSHTFQPPTPDARLTGLSLIVNDSPDNVAATFAVDFTKP